MSAADREQYDAYVQTRLQAFHDFAGFGAFVWREGVKRADEEAFRGPWHVVRPHVSSEFRVWIDEYFAPRLTFSEWQAEAIHSRRAESGRVRDYLDSAAYCTDQLEQWRELTMQRDALIADARERGATFAELMASTGLSRMALHTIVSKARAAAELVAAGADWDEPF